MNQFELQPYRSEYQKQLVQIWEDSVLATHYFLSPADFRTIKEIVNAFDFHELQVLCAVQGDQVAGFIGVADRKVEMLFVSPEYFGQRLGLKLLQYAVTELQADRVDVNEQNQQALNFYRKFGFETFERTEKDDLGMNYPILRMELKR